jgi:hypothetical protein
MALEEYPREDLIRDGVAMPIRGQFVLDDGQPLFAGFRAQGQLSLYFGEDPVLQFDRVQSVRRVYLRGMRYAAEDGRLVGLMRDRRGGRVELSRHSLDEATHGRLLGELEQLIVVSERRLVVLDRQAVVGVPDSRCFLETLRCWFKIRPRPVAVARSSQA